MRRLFNRTSTNRVSLADSMKNFCKQGVENRDFISPTYGGTISHHSTQQWRRAKNTKEVVPAWTKQRRKSFFEKVAVKNRIFIPTTYEEYFFKRKKEVAHE